MGKRKYRRTVSYNKRLCQYFNTIFYYVYKQYKCPHWKNERIEKVRDTLHGKMIRESPVPLTN